MVAMVIMIVVIGWQYSHIAHIHQLEYANFTQKSYSPTAFFTKIWLQHFCYKAMLVFLRWGPWSKRRENFIEIRKIKKNKQTIIQYEWNVWEAECDIPVPGIFLFWWYQNRYRKKVPEPVSENLVTEKGLRISIVNIWYWSWLLSPKFRNLEDL